LGLRMWHTPCGDIALEIRDKFNQISGLTI
jgi:hypothetical protein